MYIQNKDGEDTQLGVRRPTKVKLADGSTVMGSFSDAQLLLMGIRYEEPVVQPEEQAVIARRNRARAVREIVVTITGGKKFNGDEHSQSRMMRALKVAEITGQTSTTWRLADNSDQEVTVAEMEEALVLSLQAQSAAWFI